MHTKVICPNRSTAFPCCINARYLSYMHQGLIKMNTARSPPFYTVKRKCTPEEKNQYMLLKKNIPFKYIVGKIRTEMILVSIYAIGVAVLYKVFQFTHLAIPLSIP